ncbi:MAG: type II toxin-antitoxin system VapC family toxin [Sulfuricella sp.]|nr:type II toxin-antitoxin system VapC family toxin [Sulfuricella sp.]
MKLLLDAHALLWWFTDDTRLPATARQAIADERNEIFVSAASAWEIATKQRIGKLEEVPEAARRFAELVEADGFLHLPISHLHALRAGGYPSSHRDPFDRVLAAQSELDSLVLLTCDPAFADFPCQTFW